MYRWGYSCSGLNHHFSHRKWDLPCEILITSFVGTDHWFFVIGYHLPVPRRLVRLLLHSLLYKSGLDGYID